jgi:hypothetical protein
MFGKICLYLEKFDKTWKNLAKNLAATKLIAVVLNDERDQSRLGSRYFCR